jgi:zinc transporter ZupT
VFQDVSLSFLGMVLGFGSGTFIYISTTGIIPELIQNKRYAFISLVALMCAYLSILLMETLFHAH